MKCFGTILFAYLIAVRAKSTVKLPQKAHCSVTQLCGPNCTKIEQQLEEIRQEIRALRENKTTGSGNGKVYKNCAEVYKNGDNISGVYKINPDGLGEFEVFCDQKTAGGGWTVFQKRRDGSVDFFRGWNDYKNGFGHLNGTAGDSLDNHRGMSFSTRGHDNDKDGNYDCALMKMGGWWYNSCYKSNLNVVYSPAKVNFGPGMNWYHWKNNWVSVKSSEMKIRPKCF